jgi:hypothetical protein
LGAKLGQKSEYENISEVAVKFMENINGKTFVRRLKFKS